MAQQVSFCKSWFRAKKRATEMWGQERALEAHKAKTLYTVLIGTPSAPTCFLEINDKFVGVGFLDSGLREALYYSFQEVEPGVLFLGMATSRTFQGDSDKVAAGTTYLFKRNGQVQVQRQRFDPHEVEARESSCDVSPNYSRWPEFGEYDGLVVVERVASREA